jgi:glycosyltransferase involved in cell wall biosynthesis
LKLSTGRKEKSKKVILSVVTPAFNEEKNLPLLYNRLKNSMDQLNISWEWIVVDDHSADRTYQILEKLTAKDRRVRVARFACNAGSHLALACGFKMVRGKSAVCIAADLQDPPELIGQLVSKWKRGGQIVWAVRDQREGESFSTQFLSRLYYFIVRHVVGLKQIPPTGADFFLLDKLVLKKLAETVVRNTSLFLLISSFSFRQDFITYTKKRRVYGKSGWSLKKKLKLFLDSITMFSKVPIYWLLGLGLLFIAGAFILFLIDNTVHGFFYLDLFLVLVGLSMIGTGTSLLLHLANIKDESPIYIIEKSIN